MKSLNICAGCGREVGQKEGGFTLDKEKDRFELRCADCLPIILVVEK